MDYKKTLNMPQTAFEMKANLNQKEPMFQNRWLEDKIYEKVLLKNQKKQSFILHDGPPYANGDLHVGHALNKVLKDIVVRSKTMQGFYAPYIPGWDTHGLPIELAMLKKHKKETNETVVQTRQKCYQYALEQIERQKEQFQKMGLLTDFKKIYRTLDHDFEIKQLELFLEMLKQKLIFRDRKPIYWSWSSQSALAEAEIEYANIESDSTYLTFKTVSHDFLGDNVFLLVWTTTPWTLPSNLAVAVHPNLEYSLIEVNKKKIVVAKMLIEKLTKKLEWNDVKILKTFLGSKLENIQYQHPFIDRISPIILAEYVSAEDGTGLVHNAPGFGLDDYLACKKYGIEIYCPIDDFGKFNEEINDSELENMFYLNANPIIIQRLKDKHQLVLHEKIIHSAAHDWRTKKPVMYRATKQWFVNLEKIKDKIIASLNNDVKSPNKKSTQRMIETISKRIEWCISRQRVWGVPIPIIFDENYEPIYDLDLVQNIINVLDKNGTDVWFEWDVKEFLTPKYLETKKTFYKEKDIVDVWFDSGSSHNLFEIWKTKYPCDLYLEGNDQFRGWFNSSLITGVIKHNKAPYKALVSHGFVLDEKGFKMSKSKGNTVDPLKVFQTFGVDVFRLWVANAEYWDDQRIGDNILKQISEIYRRIRNTLFRYSLSNLNNFDWKKDLVDSFLLEDEFILNELNKLLVQINLAYQKYEFNVIVKMVNEFTLMLSSWYFDLIKDSLYCDQWNSLRNRQIQTVIYHILVNLTKALSPILVHTCEEVYSFFQIKKYESVHLEDWFQTESFVFFDEKKHELFKNFFVLKNLVYTKLEELRQMQIIKKNNEAIVYLKNNNLNLDEKTLEKWLMVAKVKVNETQNEEIIVKNSQFRRCERCWNHYDNRQFANDDLCCRCFSVINLQEKQSS